MALNLHYTIKEPAQIRFQILNPIIKISYNSTLPAGYNDGAVWKGKGLNAELHAGFSGSFGVLSYTFQPVFFSAQNQDFTLANLPTTANPYNYQFNPGSIDWVQRYGANPYTSMDWGQSEIKLAYKGMKVSFGTQNFVLGPANYFPILMSNNAAGMPNINFGTDGAQKIKIGNIDIGKVEGNIIIGWMSESGYFDAVNSNNQRYYNSFNLSYQPSVIPSLTIGINKVLYKQVRFWETRDLLSLAINKNVAYEIIDNDTIFSHGNDFFDQMTSITGEWCFSSVGFRVYAEYALNDFNSRPKILEPEHARAYVLGFQKLFSRTKFDLILNYEHVNLSRNHTYLHRAEPTYYVHGLNKQGYTNKGQVMGSSTGPGSNADHIELKLKLKKPQLLMGLYGRRTEFNKDYFVTHDPDFRKHHVGIDFGVNSYLETKNIILGFEVTYTHEYNRYYVKRNNQSNLYAGVSLQAKITR